ncbi:MAG: hypothetical protein CBC29_02030 [Methylococcaceae bacterium TMED69]|nr:MAG: hypothetical protein CBC29_02030 [Methylococcaceae bacterium TMED69]|tara:strand:- start:202 stop:1389 length:1188 start_codon:yes stop_codon:yes gene_type:complete
MRKNDIKSTHFYKNFFISVFVLSFSSLLLINTCNGASTGTNAFSSKHYDFSVKTVLNNLDNPWGLAFVNPDLALITLKNGEIVKFNMAENQVARLSGPVEISKCGQGGLMDIALHPDFETNQLVYFSFSKRRAGNCGTEVARANLTENGLENTETIFIANSKNKDPRHFGSRLLFLQDKTLVITLGDRGHRPNGQDIETHPGSIIRINDDGSPAKNNPFSKSDNPDVRKVFSWGHRNVQGVALQEKKIWAVEHGPMGGCELNLIQPGKNYGWADVTYGRNYVTGTKIGLGIETKEGIETPIYQWTPSNAPSSLMIYQKDTFSKWKGSFFVTSLTYNVITRLEFNGATIGSEERLLDGKYGRLRLVSTDSNGFIYVLTDGSNAKLLKIAPITQKSF